MDNRRVAKVYRDRSQRVKKLPFAAPAGLFSKVKRYLSTGAIPSRIASFGASSDANIATQKQPETTPKNEPSFVLPDSFVSTNTSTFPHVAEDSNRILSSFFQEKGDKPLSQVEYEGVMSLLDKSKASVTLPLPESTPEKATKSSAANHANNTFAQYSQKVLRNTSGYDATNTSNLTADYKPVYHTFSDVSRGNISMKRVYPLSGAPLHYRTRIQAPNLAARKARRIASATPSAASPDPVAETPLETDSFKPRSKTANSLLQILDNKESEEAPAAASESTAKPFHNPYARPRRFTPLQKEQVFEKSTSPINADEISKTVSYNKAEELKSNPADDIFSSERGGSENSQIPAKKDTLPAEKPVSDPAAESAKPAFSFGAPKTSKNAFELPDPSTDSSGLFGNKPNGESLSKTSSAELRQNSKSDSANEKPAFSFGSKSSTFGEENKETSATSSTKSADNVPETTEGSKPLFSFGTSKTDQKTPSFSFGSTAASEKKPAFSFGSKTSEEKPSINFGNAANSKPAFNFGAKKDNESTANNGIETVDVDSGSESDTKAPQPSLFTDGSKPASGSLFGKTPTIDFGAKPSDGNSGTENPSFSFGAKPASDKPSISFGAKPAEEKPSFSFGGKVNGEKSALNFGTKAEVKPAPAFSFGKPSEEKPAAEKPVLNFGAKPVEDKPVAKPAFNFGAKQLESNAAENPAFKFGSKPAEGKPSFDFNSNPAGKTSVTEKPAFNFGSTAAAEKPVAKPSFNFGSKPAEEKSTEKPSFNFGAKPAESTEKLAFNFGAKPAEEKSTEKPSFSFDAKPAEKSAFSFGSKPSENTPEAKSSFTFGNTTPAEKPAFNFGSKPSQDEPVAKKPAFSFSTQATEEKSKEKPAFSFGARPADKPAFNIGSQAAEEKIDAEKSTFEFGAKAEKPSFSFGAKPSEDKPAFNFGAKTGEEKPAESKSAFTFGAKPAEDRVSETPAFSFGAKPAAKPAFNFGAKPAEKPAVDFGAIPTNSSNFSFGKSAETGSKPAFSFGSKPSEEPEKANGSDDSTQKPAFSFGSKSSESSSAFSFKPAIDKPAFSFGTTSSEAKPAFSFGSGQASQPFGSNGANGVNGTKGSALEDEFEFPEAPVQKADLNPDKVKEYEDLFQF